jgi:hypothetical protein
MAVGEDPELVRFLGVERDHRAPAHAQELLHRHAAAAEHNRQFNIDTVDLGFAGHRDGAYLLIPPVEPERVAGA